jgi:MSHA biogenesis protein MshL
MKSLFLIVLATLMLAACESQRIKQNAVHGDINGELAKAAQQQRPAVQPETVRQALLPPLTIEMPNAPSKPVEPRFDLAVSNAPANQVFMALVSGTRYSMLVHPDIKEAISVNLKDVTITEALEAIRELYGYEFKFQGMRIYIMPVTLQTRLFQVNYLAERRVGRADVRVTSGSIQTPAYGTPGQGVPGVPSGATMFTPGQSYTPGASTAQSVESSRITTTSDNDFWNDLTMVIRSMIGAEGGRTVVVSAQAGVVMVRALPSELRSVEQYLKAMSLTLDRQVMLEAKIIEVTLSEQFGAGINWAAFTTGPNSRFSAGIMNPGTTLRTDGSLQSFTARGPDGSLLQNSTVTMNPAAASPQSPDPVTGIVGSVGSITSAAQLGANAAGAIFGLAFQTANFAALLNFLETQGTVHVLSSPRIAAINNQKAVIKVGTDEFFVTNVSTTTTSTGTTSTVSPTITVQPFFSGIALDVTPQISEQDLITLHIHPSVSQVTDKAKTLNLGTLGTITLPLASSNVNESDTIVRLKDGTIAAIGGLMRQSQMDNRSGLPGTTESTVLGSIFGSRTQQLNKSELVILLKVTIIKGDSAWQQQAQELSDRVQTMRRPPTGDQAPVSR